MPQFNPLKINSFSAPQPNYRWLVQLPPVGSLDQTKIWAERVSLPVALRTSGRTVFLGGNKFKFSDYADYEDMSITFYEDQTMSAFNFFKAWQELVIDNNGFYGVKSDYAFPIVVFLFGTLDNTIEVKQWTLNSCWPTTITPYDLSYEQSGRLVTAVSFSCDQPQDTTTSSSSYSASSFSIASLANTLTNTAKNTLTSLKSNII